MGHSLLVISIYPKVSVFMDQDPSYHVAKFVFECMEYRRSGACDDWNPCSDLSFFGENSEDKCLTPLLLVREESMMSHLLLLG
jgi:hypothetical protein